MTDSPSSQTSHVSLEPGEPHTAFSLRDVFVILFFYPQFLLNLLQADWRRAVIRVAAISIACGVLTGLVHAVNIAEKTMAWAGWMRDHVETLEVADGTLSWERPEEMPYTAYFQGWQIDFHGLENAGVFDPRRPPGTYPRGIWVTPSRILLWRRSERGEEVQVQPVFKEGKIFGHLTLERAFGKADMVVSGPDFEAKARRSLWLIVPFYIMLNAVLVPLQILLYVSIFSIIPYLLKSPLAAGGFRSVFAFYIYASLPALLVATVYTLAGIKALDFNTIFIIIFMLYLGFALWRFNKRGNMPSNKG